MALIDRDRLLSERMKSKYYHLPNGDIAVPLIDIENAPTVDAVPVVRCKDCARFDKKRGCNLVDGLNIAKTDSFCSYGERKDGDNG